MYLAGALARLRWQQALRCLRKRDCAASSLSPASECASDDSTIIRGSHSRRAHSPHPAHFSGAYVDPQPDIEEYKHSTVRADSPPSDSEESDCPQSRSKKETVDGIDRIGAGFRDHLIDDQSQRKHVRLNRRRLSA